MEVRMCVCISSASSFPRGLQDGESMPFWLHNTHTHTHIYICMYPTAWAVSIIFKEAALGIFAIYRGISMTPIHIPR